MGCCGIMTSCLAKTVICNSGDVILKRVPISDYDYSTGRWQEVLPTTETIKANVQPVSGKELDQVPEGRREKSVVKIYTLEPLRGVVTTSGEKTQPDIIEYKGEDYEVFIVWNWGEYYKALATVMER